MSIEAEIRGVLEAKAAALLRRDAAALEALLDPGFAYLNAGGHSFDRAAYIETYCISGRVIFLAQEITALRIVPHDGFAIATLVLRDRFEAQGRVVEGEFRSLCVFGMTEGSWRWVAGQTMAAPPR